MLRSLAHHQSTRIFVGLIGLAALTISLKGYCKSPQVTSEDLSALNIHMMSSEELLANADTLTGADALQDSYDANQRLLNAQWLEASSRDAQDSMQEGSDALHELAQSALKISWKAFIHREPRYAHYTPLVEGHLAVSPEGDGGDYDLRLSGDSFKISYTYAF